MDEGRFITENVLVHKPSWPGPLVVVVFVAFNTSQLIAKCLGRNGTGDVIECFLVFGKSCCILPVQLMQDSEGGLVLGRRVLVTGLSEHGYMSRTAPGPVLVLHFHFLLNFLIAWTFLPIIFCFVLTMIL